MFTIAPPCSTSWRPKAWQQKKTPVCMTSIERRHSSSGKSSDGPMSARPALLTSTSHGPRSFATASAAASTDARSDTSQA